MQFMKIFFSLMVLIFANVLHSQQNFSFAAKADSNVTFAGRWAYGTCATTEIAGNVLYFGNGGFLEVADISVPGRPTKLSKVLTPGVVWDIAVNGDYAYVANFSAGLRVIDISDSSNLQEVGSLNTEGTALGVVISGQYIYLTVGEAGFRVIDISTPETPVEVGSWDTNGTARGLAVSGNLVFVADAEQELIVIIQTRLTRQQRFAIRLSKTVM